MTSSLPENIKSYIFKVVWSYLYCLSESMGKDSDDTQADWYKLFGALNVVNMAGWVPESIVHKTMQRLVKSKEDFLILKGKSDSWMSESFVRTNSDKIRHDSLDDIKSFFNNLQNERD